MVKPWQRYIVPFFGYNSNIAEKAFIKTAFIVKPFLLITAGHNILDVEGKNHSNYFVVIDGQVIELKKRLFIKYGEGKPVEGKILDLVIYDLRGVFESIFFENAFSISSVDVSQSIICSVYGFRSDPTIIEPPTCGLNVTLKNLSSSLTGNYNEGFERIHNCFEIKEYLYPGYSGCPVYERNTVYGMVISGMENLEGCKIGTRLLKSGYINEILSTI
jgi:hypothetical protein